MAPLVDHIANRSNDCQSNEIGDRAQESRDEGTHRLLTSPGEFEVTSSNRSYGKLGRTRVFGQ